MRFNIIKPSLSLSLLISSFDFLKFLFYFYPFFWIPLHFLFLSSYLFNLQTFKIPLLIPPLFHSLQRESL